MTESTLPAWLSEGARVVTVSSGGAGTPSNTRVTTVKRISAKSFTVEGEDVRFRLDAVRDNRAESNLIGGTWGFRRLVFPYDSEEGQREVRAMRWRSGARRVDVAYEAWRRSRSDEDLQALREALDAVPSKAAQ